MVTCDLGSGVVSLGKSDGEEGAREWVGRGSTSKGVREAGKQAKRTRVCK